MPLDGLCFGPLSLLLLLVHRMDAMSSQSHFLAQPIKIKPNVHYAVKITVLILKTKNKNVTGTRSCCYALFRQGAMRSRTVNGWLTDESFFATNDLIMYTLLNIETKGDALGMILAVIRQTCGHLLMSNVTLLFSLLLLQWLCMSAGMLRVGQGSTSTCSIHCSI